MSKEGLSGNYSNSETDKNAKSGIVAMQEASLLTGCVSRKENQNFKTGTAKSNFTERAYEIY